SIGRKALREVSLQPRRLVLEVDECHPAFPFSEQLYRVLAGNAHPEDVHLELHQLRIEALEEHVYGSRALLGSEFKGVMVIAECQPLWRGGWQGALLPHAGR